MELSQHDMFLTRLPSWGEPILPQVWKISEDEIDEKFPLPGKYLILEDDDDDGQGPLFLLSNPVDQDILPLFQKDLAEPSTHSRSSQDEDFEDYMADNDEDDESCSSEDSSEHELEDSSEHELEDRHEQDQQDSESEDDGSFRMDDSFDDMDLDTSNDTDDPTDDPPPPPPPLQVPHPTIAWIIEAHYNASRQLFFKLKISGGAYMILMVDEVIDSVNFLLEETMNSVLFKVQAVNGDSTLVYSSSVAQVVSDIMVSEWRNRGAEGYNDMAEMTKNLPPPPPPPSLPSLDSFKKPPHLLSALSRRRKRQQQRAQEYRAENHVNCLPRFRYAWRAWSGRAKVRPPARSKIGPPARVE
jgi:hypothetical protein